MALAESRRATWPKKCNSIVGSEGLELSSVQLLSHVRLFVTPWPTACQASLSITNSRSEGHKGISGIGKRITESTNHEI